MVNRNLWLSTIIMVPTVDSIQEVRMMTSNYTAEYGAAGRSHHRGSNQVWHEPVPRQRLRVPS
jgi:hypothetical protein